MRKQKQNKNTNNQIGIQYYQLQVYDYDYDNDCYKLLDNVLKSATDVAFVYLRSTYYSRLLEYYPNIKKIHIFTSIDYKDDFKSVENDSRYKIWFIDKRNPFKNCDEKFDYIFLPQISNNHIFNMDILVVATTYLKDENSIVVNLGEYKWYVYKTKKIKEPKNDVYKKLGIEKWMQ